MEIVVVGGYNVILIGLLGVGKIMLVCCMFIILLFLNLYEVLEIIKIYFVVGVLLFDFVLIVNCLFWLFYYIISDVVFVGGGSNFMFGEIFLVYYGVLFLDELFEFKWMVLEVLW